jgi:hypothetical protein
LRAIGYQLSAIDYSRPCRLAVSTMTDFLLRHTLPLEIRGYPTNFGPTDEEGISVLLWERVPEFGGRVFRVVTLDDGETVHNAFPDRRFVVRENGREQSE